MSVNDWNTVLRDNLFGIDYENPSKVVKENEGFFKAGIKLLDVGCGNGRNSFFAISRGVEVDAFDICDLEYLPVKGFNFSKVDLKDFEFRESEYDIVVASRFIQYLKPDEFIDFISKINFTLKESGLLLISYAKDSWVLDANDIVIYKNDYNIGYVTDLLMKYFNKIDIKQTVVPSPDGKKNKLTYDIKALK